MVAGSCPRSAAWPVSLAARRASAGDQREQSDSRLVVVVRRSGEQERDGRPEQAERGEYQTAEKRAAAQRRLGAREPRGGPQLLAVGDRDLGTGSVHGARENHGEYQHHDPTGREDRAPAEGLPDKTCDSA